MFESNRVIIIQQGKVEEVLNEVTFRDEHPKIKNITCSLLKLGQTGLPLYQKLLTGKNAGTLQRLVPYKNVGIYAEPRLPTPFEVGDEYVILAMEF